MNYQVADTLIRIKNAYLARHKETLVFKTKMAVALVKILEKTGFIEKAETEKNSQSLKVMLKFIKRKPALTDIKIISKPSLRIYASKKELPRVLGGLGIAIVSTSKGLMTVRDAKKQGIGGELLAKVW